MKTIEALGIHFPSHHIRADDGARIRYFDTGEDLPPVIFANGLGGPISAWHPYLERWRGEFRILTWDYRGLYGSTLPHRTADISVQQHARDLGAVMDAAGLKEAAFLGWSMGVQVGLEFFSQSPTSLSHLALINGTFGQPLRGIPLPFSDVTLPPLVRGAGRIHALGSKVLRTVSKSPLSFHALRKLKVIAPGLREDRFREMIEEFKTVDLELYFELLEQLSEHNAEQHLGSINIPTLVITGSRDVLTPPTLARRIAREVPNSELFVITGATHYAAAEYPEIVASRLESFFKKQP